MSTVTASPDTTVKHAPSRLTRTLPRATASAGVLAAAATTASAAVLRAAGIPLAVHGKIPLAAFAQLTFIAAVSGGVLLAVLIRRSSAPRQRFVRITAGLTALSCVAPAGVRGRDCKQDRPCCPAPSCRGDHCSCARTTR